MKKANFSPYSSSGSDSMYRIFLDNLPQAYAYHKIKTDEFNNPVSSSIVDYNNQFKALAFQPKSREYRGKSLSEVIPEFAFMENDWIKEIKDLDTLKTRIKKEIFIERLEKWYSITIFSPEKGYFSTFFDDITPLRAATNSIVQSEQLLNHIFNVSTDAMRLVDTNLNIIKVNDLYAHFCDANKDELVGKKCHEYFCENKCHTDQCTVKKIQETGTPIEETLHVTLKNGNSVYFLFQAVPLKNASGEIIAVLESFKDISKIKQAELDVTKHNLFLQNLIDSIPSPIFFKDSNGRYQLCNNAFSEYLGIGKERIINATVFDISPEELAHVYHQADNELMQRGGNQVYEAKVKYADQSIHDVVFNKSVTVNENGETTGILGVIHDITSSKQNERILKENEKKYRLMTENMRDVIWTMDLNLQSTYVSPSIVYLTGYTADEHMNQGLYERFTQESADKAQHEFHHYLQKIYNGEISDYHFSFSGELEYKHKDGHTVWAEIRVTTLRDDSGSIIGIQGVSRDISERKKVKDALLFSEQNYKEAQKIAKVGNWRLDFKTGQKFTSDEVYSIFEIEQHEDLFNKDVILSIVHPDDHDFVTQKSKTFLIANHGIRFHYRIITRSGKLKYIDQIGRPIYNEAGERIAVGGTIKDVSEEKKSQMKFRERSKLFRLIFELSPDSVSITDPSGNITECNQAAVTLFGFESKAEIIGKSGFDLLDPLTVEQSILLHQQILEKGYVHNVELPFLIKNGKKIITLYSAELMRSIDGNVTGILSIAKDITDRKNSETELQHYKEHLEELVEQRTQELEKSEDRFRSIIQHLTDIVIIVDKELKIIYQTPSAERCLGYKNENIIGDFAIDYIHPEDLPLVEAKLSEVYHNLNPQIPTEVRVLHANAHWVPLEIVANNMLEHPAIRGIILTARDITERKKAHDALKHSEVKFRNIFNFTSDAISITDIEGNFLEVNTVAIERSGLTREEFLKLNIADILHLEKPHGIKNYKKQLLEQGSLIFESEYFSRSGKKIYLEIHSRVIEMEGRIQLLHVTRDISERKEMNRKLVSTIFKTEETERNRFAKDLHDGIGALLSGIKMYLNLIQKDKFKSPEAKKEIIEKAKEIVSQAVQSTREIAYNIKPHELSHFGLVVTINSFIEKYQGISNIHFEFAYEGLTSKVPADIELVLFRILTELVNNTIKHADASLVTIRLSNTHNAILMFYSDNGKGFDQNAEMDKDKNKGMGLMNIINRVNSMDSRIEIDSEPGKGMKVSIEINLQ